MRIKWRRVFLIALPIAVAVVLLIPYLAALISPPPPPSSPPKMSGGQPIGGVLLLPGHERPPTIPAAEATLDDNEEVIGVVVNGQPRAYRIKAMTAMTDHVINDVIDSVPVSVTYCNLNDYVQAFTGPQHGQPLDIWTAGHIKEMMLKTGDTFFWQQTGKLVDPKRSGEQAFARYEFNRVTWKAWRSAYPETDVYVGNM